MTRAPPGDKQERWLKVHREKIPCPRCQKVMSRRAIRWRHVCKGLKQMSQEEEESRRQKYADATLADFQQRTA
jgi:uncharacterized C2H2 Zn-finger protein